MRGILWGVLLSLILWVIFFPCPGITSENGISIALIISVLIICALFKGRARRRWVIAGLITGGFLPFVIAVFLTGVLGNIPEFLQGLYYRALLYLFPFAYCLEHTLSRGWQVDYIVLTIINIAFYGGLFNLIGWVFGKRAYLIRILRKR